MNPPLNTSQALSLGIHLNGLTSQSFRRSVVYRVSIAVCPNQTQALTPPPSDDESEISVDATKQPLFHAGLECFFNK
jgi:hypothetical protein